MAPAPKETPWRPAVKQTASSRWMLKDCGSIGGGNGFDHSNLASPGVAMGMKTPGSSGTEQAVPNVRYGCFLTAAGAAGAVGLFKGIEVGLLVGLLGFILSYRSMMSLVTSMAVEIQITLVFWLLTSSRRV